EPLGPSLQRGPHLRRPQDGRLEGAGRPYRTRPAPEPTKTHIDALQLGEDLRQAEMLGASDGHRRTIHTGVAEGADALAGALVDQSGGSPRARAAVGERVVGGRTDERGAGASRAQGEDVAERARVAQLVT